MNVYIIMGIVCVIVYILYTLILFFLKPTNSIMHINRYISGKVTVYLNSNLYVSAVYGGGNSRSYVGRHILDCIPKDKHTHFFSLLKNAVFLNEISGDESIGIYRLNTTHYMWVRSHSLVGQQL